ncbi:MAG TPA: class I SAM-dependent methyltransferase [Solirubrobacterales bacterium]|nr:class I SAM-dependent methyltransferase [Solirubrobacterales bacterium]
MRLNAHIPPDSPAATAAHRAVMAVGAVRLAGREEAGARAIAAALRDTAAGRMAAGEREWIGRVEARRAEVPFAMVAEDPAADGSAADRAGRLASAWETCRWTSLPPLWGRFLTRLVGELSPRSCLELGTGLGLSACYQGAALELRGAGSLTTMDAHPAARIGERGFADLGLDHRVKLEFGPIDDTLAELLGRIGPVDYALFDADHSEEATVRHFDAVLPHLTGGAVVLLDDVTQTDEMRRAWRSIASRERVQVAVGLRRIGVAVLSQRGPGGPSR